MKTEWIRIRNMAVPFDSSSSLSELAAKRLRMPVEKVLQVKVVRKAVDARHYHGAPIQFVYVLDVAASGAAKIVSHLSRDKNVSLYQPVPAVAILHRQRAQDELRPVVVGFGPSGMFAGLVLARAGMEPIILERGQDVETRQAAVHGFWQGGPLQPDTNVQFGEGGAGTFSDGKLTTRINDAGMQAILADFVAAGAPEEILYLHKPHIGTDLLAGIVKHIREEIIRLGGEVRFNAQLTGLETSSDGVGAVIINGEERLPVAALFLGIGHSARDTYAMLYEKGLHMEAKPFAVGVRIEHPQEFIDRAQYGADAADERLPVADYALTWQDKAAGRGVYSFCMCPGGQVVAAASEEDRVVTNGMSNYRRDSGIANSALLVTVRPDDFGSEVLAGMEFQREIERLAYEAGGRNYFAPVQTVGDFLTGRSGSKQFLTKPTYEPGVLAADLHHCLPDFLTAPLAKALPHFDHKIPGFADPGAVMTGVEARSSAPCRIRRDRQTFQAENIRGLYPMGEGAGYAGGIMSAAVDGRNAALAFLAEEK
jgi:uncharacterized FAD-dependent dehydrogenase